jgi:DNA-binding transcriptional regulator LsrR (DeoR family)
MAEGDNSRFDDAARAGWLYYIAGRTQDDIAQILNISRPSAQRLVSLCRSEGLISFQMNHPISQCMDLAERLRDRYELVHCDVAPSDGSADTASVGVASLGGVLIERWLRSRKSLVMALGTGRSMRASIERVPRMSCPLHRLVSLVGTISPDGSASPFDTLVKLAEITRAQHFPMPLPLFVSSAEERAQLLEIESVRRVRAIAGEADVWLMGISQIADDAVLYRDGFMSRSELLELVRLGGVGEVTGWVFDADGAILDRGTNTRVTSVPPQPGSPRPRICIGQGAAKVAALRAALKGRVVNGLITDEATAAALLDG